jgi:hypothetical protein
MYRSVYVANRIMHAISCNRGYVDRLERQLRRLRNRLADAWGCERCPAEIHRLEALMQDRWRLLENARRRYHLTTQPD